MAAFDFMPYCSPQSKKQQVLEYPLEAAEMLQQQVRLLLSSQEHVQDLEEEKSTGVKNALKASLSPSNCLLVREFSTSNSLSQLTACCDAFIRDNLEKMLDDSTSEENIIGLPRVQVNVDVSRHTSRDKWAPDQSTITGVVHEVVKKLSERFPYCPPHRRHLIEENLVSMELMADLSVELIGDGGSHHHVKSSENNLNLSKLPSSSSPAHKMGLKKEQLCRKQCGGSISWEVVATHNLVGMGAVSMVRCENNDLLVLNIQLVTKDTSSSLCCPISPTTGIPLAPKDSFFAQMDQSRSGFSAVAIDDTLMSVGGFNRNGVLKGVECFICGTNSWVQASNLLTPRARLAAVSHESKVYAIGGCDGKRDLNTMEVFSNWEKQWEEVPARMTTARSDFGAAILDGRIYAVGGARYSNSLRSAEIFNPSARKEDRKWKAIASMATPRRGVAVVSCNGCVYAIGGQASSWGCLKSVECYHPTSNEWRKVASMSIPRRNAAAVEVDGRIYVIGGYNETSAVNSMEVYDPVANSWTVSKPMVLKRSGSAAVFLHDAIYIVGGFTGSIFLNIVEKYELDCQQWTSYFSS